MNKRQTILTWTALAFLGVSLIHAPWAVAFRVSPVLHKIEHAPIFSPPERGTLAGTILFYEWAAGAVAYVAMFKMFKTKTQHPL